MKRAEILERARQCVCGERENEYGSPERSFETIALLWNDYLSAAHPDLSVAMGIDGINTVDVAVMMALLKIARIAGKRATPDSFVDLAGYAACGGEIATAYEENNQNDGLSTVYSG